MGEPTAKSSYPEHETPASYPQLTEFVKTSDDGLSDPTLTSGGDLSKQEAGGGGEVGLKDKDMDVEQGKEEDHTCKCYAMVVDKIEDSVYNFAKAHQRKISKGFKVLLYLAFMAYFAYAMSYSVLYVGAAAGLLAYLSIDVFQDSPESLQSFIGLLCLVILTFIFSSKPSKVNWHLVFWGFILQFVFAILTLRTEAGYSAFKWVGDLVSDFIALSDRGTKFVIGDIKGGGLLFQIGGVAVFFNSFIFLMNHYGVIEVVVKRLGGLISLVLETGPVESVIAAANIFIGLTEAPLLIRPFLPHVTRSELCTIMTCGFASVSGSTLAIWIRLGVESNHLLTAAVISAPAALTMSKLICPETESVDLSKQKSIRMTDDEERLAVLKDNRGLLESYMLTSSDATYSWVDGDIIMGGNQTLVGGVVAERTEIIATYALCGFSAVSGIGITLGALIPMSPARRVDVVQMILRAWVAGNLASFITGSIAGTMFVDQGS
ncbi:solute carrier family 28 member 3-like [Aplysia californica]|uniref:Solute carrier family 28 member 3-like n=1 Tax=Aplysia californica TaxID=6500 RepID=A0ABM0JN87_APLCA|nr:solute carrier family 28 member 3-like [Aplysia californica]